MRHGRGGEPRVNVLLLNGPNLNLLGEREPEVYGSATLQQVEQMFVERANERGRAGGWCRGSEKEAVIDKLHGLRRWANGGVVFNPGAYTHTSYALRDAIA